MKRLSGLTILFVFLLVSTQAMAGVKISELLADPEFAAMNAEQRLAMFNQKIEEKTMSSTDISSDIMSRLFMDTIVNEADPTAMITRYGQLRAAYPKLPSCYELERSLAVQYLATNPETKGGDDLVRLKALLQLENGGMISWPGVATLYTGILANHLAANAEYQAMSHADRISYIRRLTADGIVKDMTATDFIRGEGFAMLSALPLEEQGPALKSMEAGLDFFSKSALNKGYVE